MRILVFNWHEPYLALLASTGHEWVIADWHRAWDERCRPLPPNARRCGAPEEAARLIEAGGADLLIAQTAADLHWLGDRPVPLVYLAHNTLGNEAGGPGAGQADALRNLVATALERRGGRFVAISEMKRESWGLAGLVIPPGIDVEAHGGWSGEVPVALTVANLLRERAHMLGATELETALAGLPWRLLGINPTLGTEPAASWEALRTAYRTHRVYVHATLWPSEDGYNLALLEAMATGMPVVTWASPTSPISEGLDGLVAHDPEELRHWVRRLLEDPALGARLGAAARRTAARLFPVAAFRRRWAELLGEVRARPTVPASPPATRASVSGRGASPAPGRRLRVVLASTWTPISTASYYERAFRAHHEVLTWGPAMDEATLGQWQAVTEQHALKPAGSAEEKIRLLRGLTRPADIPGPKGQPSVGALLAQLPRGWQPDLFVWIDGGPEFLPLELERLDCPTVCLAGDTHTQLDWRLAYARLHSHAYVTFNRQHLPRLREAGCAWVGWLPAACDPEIHRPFDVPKAFDVVFVGQTLRQWHPDRVRLLEGLIAAGLDVHVTTKILEEMALAFARGRLVFNRSLAGDLNMRVFEALATGSLLLTDRLAPEAGLEALFRDRVHLVCYGEDDLEDLARHYLAHPDERQAIGRAGREAVLAGHTYAHRVATLVGDVLGAAAGPAPAALAESALPAYYRNERPEIADLVPPSARRVLEVGCAAGALGRRLKRRGPCEVVGIEVHRPAAEVARQHLDRVLEIDLDTADALPEDLGTFDCVVCADVLEHLRDPERALRMLRRHLAPTGALIASIPNVRHAAVLLPLLVAGRWQYQDEGILDRTHLRFFTPIEILDLLQRTGFQVGSVAATRTEEHPSIAVLGEAVARLGGDAVRLREESTIVQLVVTATPAPAGTCPAPRPVGAPAVSIVIPVRDRAEFTRRCLVALARTVDPATTEVVVVDNGSTDDTSALLAGPPRPLRVLRNPDNLGFARASNQGARAARGALLVFLNNDTEPEPGWLEALERAAAGPGVGIVGARLLYPATRRIQHAGLALDPHGLPDHLWRNAPADDPRANEPRDLDMVTGACLAIQRELFLELGGFDEGYVNGVEDVELCLAVRHRGLRVRYEPRAVVLHHEGVSEGRFAQVGANLRRLAERWGTVLATMPRHPREDFGELPEPTVAWEGSFFVHHSLAGINRAVCHELLSLGVDLALTPYEADEAGAEAFPEGPRLAPLMGRPTKQPPVLRVRHRFPPDFGPRPGERLVVIQPWEFGAVPRAWVEAIRHTVEELWVPSAFVRESFIAGGVPAERVVVLPNGFDPGVFHPGAAPLDLPTSRRFRFLYVGGSIPRKGYDVALRAFVEEFSAADDVCLVVKDHAYYRHRVDDLIAERRRQPGAPEILYYFDSLPPVQLAGLYTAADCLVHPFRGEGFGLPVLEAMACGRPVIVTDAGPVREFVPAEVGRFIPARSVRFAEARVDWLETVGIPTLAEPDLPALRRAMRAAYEHPEDGRARGRLAAAHAHARYAWPVVARAYAERIRALLARPRTAGASLAEATALLAADRLGEASTAFATLIALDPDDLAALIGGAHCALALADAPTARVLLQRVVALDPANPGARAALAALAAEEGVTVDAGPGPA